MWKLKLQPRLVLYCIGKVLAPKSLGAEVQALKFLRAKKLFSAAFYPKCFFQAQASVVYGARLQVC